MTQPPRRPNEPAFLGATTSTPTLRADQPPLEIPTFLHHPPQEQQESGKHHHRSGPARLIRSVRAAFRSFPIIPAPTCRGIPSLPLLLNNNNPGGSILNHFHGSTRTTGTLYGRRRSRITIAFHDSPGSPAPALLLEMCVPTAKFMQDVSAGAGMVRVTLECEKHLHHHHHHSGELLDEPSWAAEVNGESVGHAARREATEEDERVMRLLRSTSMGAGVLPDEAGNGGEVTYMRAYFDRVVGSKDAETYYMLNPEGCAAGPELTIFFIRT